MIKKKNYSFFYSFFIPFFFFFEVDFGEYTLQVQARMSYCQIQVFLLEKNVESIQRKSAKRKRKAATQESDTCGDSYHKT